MRELSEIERQRKYYQTTARDDYERLHVRQDNEHCRALEWLVGVISGQGITSILDAGAGTGRAVRYLREYAPATRVVGIEPSDTLSAIGYENGLKGEDLVDGDATNLHNRDNEFDVVCEFGVLHHLRKPRLAISEMLRVAKRAVFISDDNHFAAGSQAIRVLKRGFRAVGLWNAAYQVRTAGRGYRLSEEDGISYPYSIFDDLDYIRRECPSSFLMNTTASSGDLFRTARTGFITGWIKV